MKNYLITLTSCIIFNAAGQAQQLRNVRIGEPIPDITVGNLLDGPASGLKLSSFGGKLLILDFWATWCTPCIGIFPKLDSLQKKFPKDLRILSVTYEEKEMVRDFLKRMKASGKTVPKVATNDTMLSKLFFHKSIPHYVWINASQEVIAITKSDQLTFENIRKAIAGESMQLPIKKDSEETLVYSGDDTTTVFSLSAKMRRTDMEYEHQIPDSSIKLYSALTGYMEGVNSGFMMHHPTILFAHNLSIKFLYKMALSGASVNTMLNSYRGGIQIDIKDSSLRSRLELQGAKGPAYWAWMKENSYCYDMKVPKEMANKKFEILLEDLNRYLGAKFGIEGINENRLQKYIALTWDSTNKSLMSKGAPVSQSKDKFSLSLHNVYLKDLVYNLRQPLQSYPSLEDETGLKEKIDIEINCDLSDLTAVNEALNKYGLRFIEKEKIMSVPVIRMKQSK